MRLSIASFTLLFASASAEPALKVDKDIALTQVRDAIANMDGGKVGSTGSLRTNSNKADVNTMFAADVAAPANFKASFKKDPALLRSLGVKVEEKPSFGASNKNNRFNSHAAAGLAGNLAGFGKSFKLSKHGEEHRQLQEEINLLCATQEDGSLYCIGQDLPEPGFLSVFICPSGSTTVDQCEEQCFIFQADDPTAVNETTPQCTSCGVCGAEDTAGFNFNCSNFSEDRCAARDCAGECINEPEIECFENADGTTLDCVLQDWPRGDLLTVFTGCPTDLGSALECSACEIPQADTYDNITDASTRCDSCTICVAEESVAYDCSIFDSTDPCAVQDCNQNCLQSASPSMAPVEPGSDIPTTPAPVTVSPTTPAPVTAPPSTAPPTTTSGAASQVVSYSAAGIFGVLALLVV